MNIKFYIQTLDVRRVTFRSNRRVQVDDEELEEFKVGCSHGIYYRDGYPTGTRREGKRGL